jgi:hypothetical protein
MGRLKELLYLTSGERTFDEDGSPKGGNDVAPNGVGCWADAWDDEVGEYRTCEQAPQPDSALGLCARHEVLLVSAWPTRERR